MHAVAAAWGHAWLVLAELLTDHGTCQLDGCIGACDCHLAFVSVRVHLITITDLDGNLGILWQAQHTMTRALNMQ